MSRLEAENHVQLGFSALDRIWLQTQMESRNTTELIGISRRNSTTFVLGALFRSPCVIVSDIVLRYVQYILLAPVLIAGDRGLKSQCKIYIIMAKAF